MFFVFCFSLLGPSSPTRKGFWFVHTWAPSFYLFALFLLWRVLAPGARMKYKDT